MKLKILFFKVLLVVFCAAPSLFANAFYGRSSLRDLSGVELFVSFAGALELGKFAPEIEKKIKARLENASVPLAEFSGKGGALKFLLTGFKKSEDEFFIYASLQLHQRAYLAVSHEYMDCQTWDVWKIGIFDIDEIFLAVEDMTREFANDFVSANSF